jgi:hypothetical protein
LLPFFVFSFITIASGFPPAPLNSVKPFLETALPYAQEANVSDKQKGFFQEKLLPPGVAD